MLKSLLAQLGEAMDREAIPYMIIGGQAVLLYGEPRLTRDIDVTLGLTPEGLPAVLRVTQRLGLQVLVADTEAFVRQTWVLPTYHEASGMRVDFIFSWTPYEQEALRRARVMQIDTYPVRFASPEDVIVHKILAGRPRDLEDVRGILRKQSVDIAYIRRWLSELDLALGQGYASTFEEMLRSLEEERGPHP